MGTEHICFLLLFLLLLLLLLLREIGNARLGVSDLHPISPKTPAPHYQPIEQRKKKEASVKYLVQKKTFTRVISSPCLYARWSGRRLHFYLIW